MKKITKIAFMCIVVLSVMMCFALTSYALTDGDWEFQLLDNEVEITKYLGDDENIVFPDSIFGQPVTSISKDFRLWSYDFSEPVKSIVYPKGIKKIHQHLMGGHDELETIVLPEGLESIEIYGFVGLKGLKTINIPNSVKFIGMEAFSGCTSLENVNIPDGVRIELRAFKGSGLTSVDMTGKKVALTTGVFSNCKNLKSIIFSDKEKEIPMEVCNGCSSLENVVLPNSITTINGYAFGGCSSLEKLILPTSLKVLWGGWGGIGLKELVIPYGVTQVNGPNGFPFIRDSEKLRAVYLPDTVTRLFGSVIENCPNAIVYCSADSYASKELKNRKISHLTDNSVNTGIQVYYNGTRVSFHSYNQNPELLQSRTLVPLRSIFEAMGAEIEWDDVSKTATAKRGGVEVRIQIGATQMQKNGSAVSLDVPAQIVNSRTMVPVRVIAEAFGADVQWNGYGNAVIISE